MQPDQTPSAARSPEYVVHRRGFVWGWKTPLNQRAYGFDFGPFALVILLDRKESPWPTK